MAELSRSRSLGRYDAVADVKKANGGVKYDAFNAAFCKVSTNVGYFLLVCLFLFILFVFCFVFMFGFFLFCFWLLCVFSLLVILHLV